MVFEARHFPVTRSYGKPLRKPDGFHLLWGNCCEVLRESDASMVFGKLCGLKFYAVRPRLHGV